MTSPSPHDPSRSPRLPRVLVVSYNFPPIGAIGTMRTLRLLRHIAAAGWETTVLTSDPATFRDDTAVDESVVARVPASVRVVRARSRRWVTALKSLVRRPTPSTPGRAPNELAAATRAEPQRLKAPGRLKRSVDAASGIPDRELAWWLPAVVTGLRECKAPDVLYSSSPPWTGQLVALSLARIWRCPWVADFRDPWSRAPWRDDRPPFVRRVNGWLERRVIRRADAVLFATRGNAADFARHYGESLARKFVFIENGCDVDEFEHITPRGPTGRFVLLHAGSLYGARNPVPLMRAAARAIQSGRLGPEAFRVRLLGHLAPDGDDPVLVRQELGLEHVVEIVSRVSRTESLAEMLGASALLLVQPRTAVSVPGKLYEYLAAGRPILAMADEGETADIVRRTGAGLVVAPGDEEQIEDALVALVTGRAPFVRAEPASYDGRVHAAETARVLVRLAFAEPGDMAVAPRDVSRMPELLDSGVERRGER